MRLPEGITDNLRFLCVEVDTQIDQLQAFIKAPSTALAQRIVDRGGYAGNLKAGIHNSCLEQIARCTEGSSDTVVLRAVEAVATDLDRIAGLCRECVKQVNALVQPEHLKAAVYGPMLKRVRRGVALVEPAVREHDTALALKIGEIEGKLDRDHGSLLQHYTDALKQREDTEDLVRALFVGHSIEQMGDALLAIGESIVSANLGQRVDMERYHSLRASVATLGDAGVSELQLERIAETRSGSAIAGIGSGARDGYVAVFKDGQKRKLKEERAGVRGWHENYPGLAPKILAYKKRGRSASLLIEHLPGLTLEKVLLHEPPALLDEALEQLGTTLRSVWHETRSDKPVDADFMGQLQARLADVYRIHPEFNDAGQRVCGHEVAAFGRVLDAARAAEVAQPAPFSVYIHGDFNLDNIIYDPIERRINFIDLHRSRYMDYVQDVSVFMVSNYRLQILDAAQRRRIMQLAIDFYRMARRFAGDVGDRGFDFRLALGLARSFATSTRFILDKSLARRMFLRARFLMEQAAAIDAGKRDKYRLPVKEIFVG